MKKIEIQSPSINFDLAETVLRKIKSEVVSTNDIIPSINLPHFYLKELNTYIEEFGLNKVIALQENLIKLEQIRSQVNVIVNKKKFKYEHASGYLATTFFGVGECGEVVHQAVYELVMAGCKSIVNIICLTTEDQKSKHVFILIGDCTCLRIERSLSSLNQLSKDCVFFDPFLKRIGNANELINLIKEYITIFKLVEIETVKKIIPAQIDCETLKNEAIIIAKEISSKLNIPYKAPDLGLSNTANNTNLLFNRNKKLDDCLASIKNAAPGTKNGLEVINSLNEKKYALALRKASAYGFLEVIEQLLNNRVLLEFNNLNEQSSNLNTALDWALAANYDENKKNRIVSLLEEAGGKRASELKEKGTGLS